MAASLEKEVFYPPPGYHDEKSKWAKLKHAAFIVLDELHDLVNTHQHASKIHGVGETTGAFLKNKFGNSRAPTDRVVPTRASNNSNRYIYPTITEAIVMALNELDQDAWINRLELVNRVGRFYQTPSSSSPSATQHFIERAFPVSGSKNIAGWKTLSLLMSGIAGVSRVGSRTRKKTLEYQLNQQGRELAQAIQHRASNAMQRCRIEQWHGTREGKKMDPTAAGIVLLVDNREGGGATHHLLEICQHLKNQRVRFEVHCNHQTLHDYCLVWRDGLGNDGGCSDYLLPLLIERKEKKDIVDSLRKNSTDRWDRQKAMMKETGTTLWPTKSSSSSGGATPIEPELMYVLENTATNLLEDSTAFDSLLQCNCSCRGLVGCMKNG